MKIESGQIYQVLSRSTRFNSLSVISIDTVTSSNVYYVYCNSLSGTLCDKSLSYFLDKLNNGDLALISED